MHSKLLKKCNFAAGKKFSHHAVDIFCMVSENSHIWYLKEETNLKIMTAAPFCGT